MNKMYRVLLTSLVLILIILSPACRTRRNPVTPDVTPTTTTIAPPDISVTATQPPAVEEPTDFVATDTAPTEEVIPTDIEELNRWAQQRGHIRDAFFNYDEATLDDAAQSALTSSANWLKSAEGRGYGLLIEGHCDERGTEQYNLALGDRRANAAKEYLMTLGIDGGRIRTVSYGEERPFEEGHDDSSWAQNRRAHLVLVR
jgi:peptidoglycan-associated lipoprotein